MIPQEYFAFEQPCPIRDVLDRIGDQWSLLVLIGLENGTRRFNELMRDIGDISKQMLSRTLKQLEQDGFVHRRVYAEVPPRVEYTLTDLGRSFLVPMKGLVRWADSNHKDIVLARGRYTAAA
ncbi:MULTISPECIES: helix-turn-helix domain-containing protein [unclassified Achromobacter]|uniref:winged helix-turn-helix transcriptional regulator n=1 Tax=unclassified Achromobacter TaxID=2626865 RepID=UPI000B51D379|nr:MULTISPECIES: helix-turn-helix domain-containing protein [unclassified Achromobacter]OWT74735.1 MarR family transcriptional regulator [Achromobacter sp. HZ34]OWT79202.1 MarR family transcriptional regulator [Achromobacter sp. HZ28]